MIEDGVYFDLHPRVYHADPALGSGDTKLLAVSPADYWFNSRLNPAWKEKEPSYEMIFGQALHCYVLEGPDEYAARYGSYLGDTRTKEGKQERDAIKAAKKIPLDYNTHSHLSMVATAVRANPFLADAFRNGRGEVSIFWTRDGVRKKARLDYLKRRAIIDLKSIRLRDTIDFRRACRARFASSRMDVQAAHYAEGRRQMARLMSAGKYEFCSADPTDAEREWALSVAKEDVWAFVFVFVQADEAPLTYAFSLSPDNPIFDVGRAEIERADNNYRACLEKYGLDTPWLPADPIEELAIEDLPLYFGR